MADEGTLLDAGVAAALVAARFGGDAGAVTPLGAGEWSRAFAFDHAGAGYVLRLSALDEDFRKDARAAAYGDAALLIPAVFEIGALPGGYYALSQRLAGGFLDDLAEAGVRAVLPALLAALDAMREVDISHTAGYGLWDGDGQAAHPSWPAALLAVGHDQPEHRTHGWRAALAGAPERLRAFETGLAALWTMAPDVPNLRHLVHSDLLNRNVLVRCDRLTAVLDWGCALYGDFLYDVAWLCFWAPWFPAWPGIDFAAEAAGHYAAIGLAVPELALRLRCYQVHIGLDGQAYNAFKGRWPAVDAIARRTLEVAAGRA